jgi:hypothetical protein
MTIPVYSTWDTSELPLRNLVSVFTPFSGLFQSFASLTNKPEKEDQCRHCFGPPPVEESIEANSKKHRSCHVPAGKCSGDITVQGSTLPTDRPCPRDAMRQKALLQADKEAGGRNWIKQRRSPSILVRGTACSLP